MWRSISFQYIHLADVELRSEIVVANILAGAALQAELAASAIIEARTMFTFAFSAAVLAENQDAVVAAISTEIAAKAGLYIFYCCSVVRG